MKVRILLDKQWSLQYSREFKQAFVGPLTEVSMSHERSHDVFWAVGPAWHEGHVSDWTVHQFNSTLRFDAGTFMRHLCANYLGRLEVQHTTQDPSRMVFKAEALQEGRAYI